MKTFYTATARNKINLCRSNYESAGNENLTEDWLSQGELTVKISELKQQHTIHDKYSKFSAPLLKINFSR